jgi:ABC-2 type transport system ATP-binding protein
MYDAGKVSFACDGTALQTVMAELVKLGIESLSCAPPSLEELFLSHYAAAENQADQPLTIPLAETLEA